MKKLISDFAVIKKKRKIKNKEKKKNKEMKKI
jgi:hypothetical protein